MAKIEVRSKKVAVQLTSGRVEIGTGGEWIFRDGMAGYMLRSIEDLPDGTGKVVIEKPFPARDIAWVKTVLNDVL